MQPQVLDGGTSAALVLLERVAAGRQLFNGDERRWVIVEGVELSGWTMTEVQLIEGGDAALAERVMGFARLREGEGASRRLTALPGAATSVAVLPAQKKSAGSESADEALLHLAAAAAASLSASQREAAIVDAMILSGGTLASDYLLGCSDAALARIVLQAPGHDRIGTATIDELAAA